MKSKAIVCTVPDKRKADAIKKAYTLPVSNTPCPSTILKTHKNNTFFLDYDSAKLLELENVESKNNGN